MSRIKIPAFHAVRIFFVPTPAVVLIVEVVEIPIRRRAFRKFSPARWARLLATCRWLGLKRKRDRIGSVWDAHLVKKTFVRVIRGN